MNYGTATVGQPMTATYEDIERAIRAIEAMPQTPWVLVAPDGRLWQDTNPKNLLRVLLGAAAGHGFP